MSTTKPSQGTHFSDGVRTGPILQSQYTAGSNVLMPSTLNGSPVDSVPPGIFNTPMSLLDIIPAPVNGAALATAQTPGAAGYLNLVTANGQGVTVQPNFGGKTGVAGSSVIVLDVPRNVIIVGTANTVTASTYTVFGLDQYGMAVVEQIDHPGNLVTVEGKKAFYVIQAIYTSAGTTGAVSAGVGNTFGLPYYVSNANYIGIPEWDGKPDVNQDNVLALGYNPVATTNTSNVVTVTVPATAGLSTGDFVTLSGIQPFNGLTSANLNITAQVTVTSPTTFTFVAGANATATGVGGGRNVTVKALTNTTITLANNPATTVNGSANVTLTVPSTEGMYVGQRIAVSGLNATGGILAADLNIAAVIVGISSPTALVYTANTAATGSATGGGAAGALRINDYVGNQYPTLQLGSNPVTTDGATASVVLRVNSTVGMYVGEPISVSGLTATGGISAANLNIVTTITAITGPTTITYTAGGVSNAVATGGGTAGILTLQGNPLQQGALSGTFVPGDPRASLNASPALPNVYASGAQNNDVRGTYTPSSNANGNRRLTINFYNASGDARNYHKDVSTSRILNNNPMTCYNGSTTVSVFAPNHQLTNGETVTISGAATFGGISAGNLNLSNTPVTVIDADNFTYVAGGAATSTVIGGGGSTVLLSPYSGNLYQLPYGRFGVTQYSIAFF